MQSQQPPAPENNPYAPPTAALEMASTQDFFVVSMRKFWIMSIATAGLYSVYWSYRHYQTIRQNSGEALWPVARAIFIVFFYLDLYRRFATRALSRDRNYSFNYLQYAVACIVVVLINVVCNQLSKNGIGVPITSALPLLLVFVQTYFLAAAQSVANFASADEQGSANANFTALNVLWMAIGALMWGLAIFGIYVTVSGAAVLRSASTVG